MSTPPVNATVNSTFQPIFNAKIPDEGPKGIPLNLDFTATNALLVDLTQQQQHARISFIQGAFVDNSQNPQVLIIQCAGTAQNVVFPAFSQGYIPLLLPNPPKFVANTTGSVVVGMVMLNIPMPLEIWSVNGTEFMFDGSGNLKVSDPALDSLIAGGGLNVNVISGGGGGGSVQSYTAYDNQLTSANSTALYTAAAGKTFEIGWMRVLLESNAACANGPMNFWLREFSTGNTLALFNFYPPVATPATPQVAPFLLWEGSNLSWKGNGTSASILALDMSDQSGGGLTAGHVWLNYGAVDIAP